MAGPDLQLLTAEIARLRRVRDVGRVVEVARATLRVSGMNEIACIGDQVSVGLADGTSLGGEVIALESDAAIIFPDGPTHGANIGARVKHIGSLEIAPDDSWIGRVIDPDGIPLDGQRLMRGTRARQILSHPPPATGRRRMEGRIETGIATFNTLLPLVRGQRLGLFAGSGVGKSTLLSRFARGVEADVVVIALIGERGREVREFVETILGRHGMKRAVVVAATSDRSALMRRRCAWSSMSIAEHFRDKGAHVLLLVDSMTRFAEAHREVALASGETASYGGYPPSMVPSVMGLAERAGPGQAIAGDITAILSVLVAASDMEGPVADTLRGVLDGHVVLDRKIAERGRYPAIDLLRSVSRSLPHAATDAENGLIADARRLLGAYDRAELMIQAGLYASGSDPEVDRAIRVWPALDRFLAEERPSDTSESFARLAEILSDGEDAAPDEEPSKSHNGPVATA